MASSREPHEELEFVQDLRAQLADAILRLSQVETEVGRLRDELAVRGERSFASQLFKLLTASALVITAMATAYPYMLDQLGITDEAPILLVWTLLNIVWVPLTGAVYSEIVEPRTRAGDSIHRFLALDVPAPKENWVRNRNVDRAAIFYLTWGLFILFPTMVAWAKVGWPSLAWIEPVARQLGRLQPADSQHRQDFALAWTIYLIGLALVILVAMADWRASSAQSADETSPD